MEALAVTPAVSDRCGVPVGKELKDGVDQALFWAAGLVGILTVGPSLSWATKDSARKPVPRSVSRTLSCVRPLTNSDALLDSVQMTVQQVR